MMSGKAIEQKNKKEFISQLKDSSVIVGVTALFLGLGIIVLGPYFVPLLTQDANVQIVANDHLLFAGIYIMFSFVAFQLDGVFIGATQCREMRNSTIFEFIIFVLYSFVFIEYFN